MSRKHEEVATEVAPETAVTSTVKVKAEPISVTMEDGRVVTFSPKRNIAKTVEGHTVRFDFRNGQTRVYEVPHSGEIAHRLAAHGASQKIGDEAAGVDSIEDMVIAVEAMIERLHKGEWGATRQPGDSFAGASLVLKAVCEVSGKSLAEVKEFLEKKLAATPGLTRSALYASFRAPSTKTGQVIARLEAERLAAKGDITNADDLLSELA